SQRRICQKSKRQT
ncbi:PCRF domain protein, partial [Vibrio parahaemolyticus EKP-028]